MDQLVVGEGQHVAHWVVKRQVQLELTLECSAIAVAALAAVLADARATAILAQAALAAVSADARAAALLALVSLAAVSADARAAALLAQAALAAVSADTRAAAILAQAALAAVFARHAQSVTARQRTTPMSLFNACFAV